jgi:poly(A) polymerase
VACITRLRAEGLHHGLLPLLDVILEQPAGERFVMLALSRTDERVQAGKHIAPGFLFATLLWHEVLKGWQEREGRGEHRIPALDTAIDDVLALQTEKLAIQRRFASDMREIWMLQPRFERRVGRSPFRMLELPRLRAGYDFLMLRCAAEEADVALGEWWTRFLDSDEATREQLAAEANRAPRSDTPRRKRRRRGNRGQRRDDAAPDTLPAASPDSHGLDQP